MGIIFMAPLTAPAYSQSPTAQASDLIRQGRVAEAQSVIDQALKVRSSDAELWNLAGILNAQTGHSGDAEHAFQKAVALAPKLKAAWLNLGRLYQQMNASGNVSAADRSIAAYETVLRLDANSAEAHHQLALLLQSHGDYRAALNHLDRLPPEDQTRMPALLIRCGSEAALGNTKAALEVAGRISTDPNLEPADVLAIGDLVEKAPAVAIRLYEALDSRHNADVPVLARLAALYERTSELNDARAVYERIARSAAPSSASLLELARVAWKQKDYEGTLGYLAHARDLDPSNAGIHFFFGIACNELRLPKEAKESLKKAIELAPANPYYNYAMGAIQLQWLEKDEAIPFLKKFVTLRPGDARGRLALATAYFGVLNDDAAREQLAIAAEHPETRAGAEYLLGRIDARHDNFTGAIGHFRRLLNWEPKSADAHAELADALLDSNDVEGARRETDAALSLEPDNYVANRTLLRLYKLAGDGRLKEQTERIQKIVQNRDARLRAMQRNLEIRPY